MSGPPELESGSGAGLEGGVENLILMAKAPVLGAVKTRLAAAIGAEAALAAYRELLSVLFKNLEGMESLTLCATPDGSDAEFSEWLPPDRPVWPQGAGDLGDRLHRAFGRAFSEGASRVVVIGADCPYVRADHIREAFRRLQEVDLVLGPADDGGYWLIGLARPNPQLFEEMPWSAPGLLGATLDVAQRNGVSRALLEHLSDIDTEDDWGRFKDTWSP